MKRLVNLTAAAAFLHFAVLPAAAEPATLHHGFQAGMPHLPALVMKHEKLLEACLADQGMGSTKVEWFELTGSAQTDALLSGNLDFTSGGVTELATLWVATHGKVKAISAESAVPNDLITTNPKIKTLKDFGPDDRIAVPAVKVSIQAIMLQMAAAKTFGPENFAKLDTLTVSMPPPDATIALLSGGGEVDLAFSVPPFQQQQLEKPGITTVLNSFDVMGASHSFTVAWTSARFREQNPVLYKALFAAMQEATGIVNKDKRGAAQLWITDSHSTLPLPFVEQIVGGAQVRWTTVPENTMTFARFMVTNGMLKTAPQSWRDYFFPEIYAVDGS